MKFGQVLIIPGNKRVCFNTLLINQQHMNNSKFALRLLLTWFSIIFFTNCERNLDTSEWYKFAPQADSVNCSVNMSDWLEAPAGKHGFLQIDNDKLVFENGNAVKFWGVNINSKKPYIPNEEVHQWVDYLSKFGVNSIRFHKFTSHGMTGAVSTKIDPELFDHFDYFQSELKKQGIYYGWSPIYGHKVRPGDSARILAYDEIVNNTNFGSHLDKSTIGLVNFAEDLQNLHIDLLVGMLNHKNPYTGLRYAEDPALAFIEIQNEDNIWFSTADSRIQACPTYKELITDKFVKWLKNKYKTQDSLVEAWGTEAFDWGREVREQDWNLDSANITPVASHGIYNYEYNKALKEGKRLPQFLVDHATFLFDQQMKYYQRVEKAIRATGYKGVIIGSCWQAGGGVPHYYNLFADYSMGMIDRHNYFGGGTGHQMVPGEFKNKSMLSEPGSGLLSTGAQQVKNRPFSLSEWMSLPPNEWIAEGAPLIALYGLGTQGWDASFSFAVDYPYFTNTIHTPKVYNVTTPSQISLYPALVSTIYNNDLLEGEVLAVKNVHVPSLAEGKIGFEDVIEQDWDQKAFKGHIPQEALAAGKVVIDFTEEFRATLTPDLSTYIDTVNKQINSSNGQLKWNYDNKGFFTVNTPSLKGMVGFSDLKRQTIGHLELLVNTYFSVVLFSSLEPGKSLQESSRILITTMARSRNTGMEFNEDKTEIVKVGTEPILLEPVIAKVKYMKEGDPVIHVLDHSGNRTGKTIEHENGSFLLDGRVHKTMYYEMVYY
jgi:hypothetical protein